MKGDKSQLTSPLYSASLRVHFRITPACALVLNCMGSDTRSAIACENDYFTVLFCLMIQANVKRAALDLSFEEHGAVHMKPHTLFASTL